MFGRSRFRRYSQYEIDEPVFNAAYVDQNIGFNEQDFSQECLRSHNHFRAQHGCLPLHLSTAVSSFSQQWADSLSQEDHFHHSHHPQYGENLFVTYMSDNSLPMASGKQVVESWYAEHAFYPFGDQISRETVLKAGHFTQVIWSGSRELGVGRAISKSNRVYVVANYYPPGNVMRKFKDNVPNKLHTYSHHNRYYKRIFTRTFNVHADYVH